MHKSRTNGFTLIEIVVVVVIISIMTVLGLQMISSGSVERYLQQHGRILQSAIEFSCEQAVLQNRPYGINFFDHGYQFSQFNDQQWVTLFGEYDFSYKEFDDGSVLSLRIDDQSIVLKDEVSDIPQVVCDVNGELTPFALEITDATLNHQYQLASISAWQIEGQWLNEE